jgi:DNA-binding MarR family transcriptional regulator
MNIESCLNLELRKANRVLTNFYDSHLASCGIKTSQFSVLRAVFILKRTSNKQLQEVLILDQTSLTRALKPLIRDGFIDVFPGTDRRKKHLVLSKQGHALYKRAKPQWEEVQQKTSKSLGQQMIKNILIVSNAIIAMK